MAAPAITLAGLRKLGPCNIPDGLPKRGKITAAKARECGVSLDGVVWVARKMALNDPDIERRLRLWIADCAAHVLHIYEQDEAGDAPRNAIVASRKFARGEIDDAARVAAKAAAKAAASDAAKDTASDAAWVAARVAASDAASDAARVAASDAASDAAKDTASDAARADEEAWQFDRLVAWLGDAEPDDWPLPEKQSEPKVGVAV